MSRIGWASKLTLTLVTHRKNITIITKTTKKGVSLDHNGWGKKSLLKSYNELWKTKIKNAVSGAKYSCAMQCSENIADFYLEREGPYPLLLFTLAFAIQ